MPESSVPASDIQLVNVMFVHTIPETGRLLPSASQWNAIELDFNLLPRSSSSSNSHDYSIPSPYSKSYDYDIVIADKKHFKRFLYGLVALILVIIAIVLLVNLLPHKQKHRGPSKNLSLAINQALMFFDAQKSGLYPRNSPVKFRGDSGIQDGSSSNPPVNLVGGFYDSGNNVKFTFTTAYTITLLSWSVIEYQEKFAYIDELDHVKNIIKWGTDYLLKAFVYSNSTSSTVLYSQVGSTGSDISCWQRPEDMNNPRPVSVCSSTDSDLAGEIIAALSAASIVFKEDNSYSKSLVEAAEKLFQAASVDDPGHRPRTYTADDVCGGGAAKFYNSSGYQDELVWGGTWLSFATGNTTYLAYATNRFREADQDQIISEKGLFYWNNKIAATAVLMTRLRFFKDPGYPYEAALGNSSKNTDFLMCSYLSDKTFKKTPGGLIILRPEYGQQLQFAATASFLSKLYCDYLKLLRKTGSSCDTQGFSLQMLQKFSLSQVNYILGDNPMKMSYVVGFGDHYPTKVHHRSASIPWDGQYHSCPEGDRWLYSKDPNPNVLLGAMVGGPDQSDNFFDDRSKPQFTEPTISSNAGLVAALIGHYELPDSLDLGINQTGIFDKIILTASTP
ncbi:putative Endo-1 4-beta-glucanase [Tripterygium wilfordii]|uniref:Endoglucanase n=1 Tax=Tripterygium wilfordii TaxID=458696 RepID=A0A7J7CIP9_TRIWF|nr:putative Endo-1 4-beta-glucanase [Tripterygium wilfordii]